MTALETRYLQLSYLASTLFGAFRWVLPSCFAVYSYSGIVVQFSSFLPPTPLPQHLASILCRAIRQFSGVIARFGSFSPTIFVSRAIALPVPHLPALGVRWQAIN